mgnify:CR=1 FL=1
MRKCVFSYTAFLPNSIEIAHNKRIMWSMTLVPIFSPKILIERVALRDTMALLVRPNKIAICDG